MNDFPTIKDLVYGNGSNLQGWLLDLSLVTPDDTNVFSNDNRNFFDDVYSSVAAKAGTGM